MAIDVQPVAAPPQAPAFTPASESADFEERWTAWRAKGAARDRAVRRRMAVVAPVLIVLAAVIVYALVGR